MSFYNKDVTKSINNGVTIWEISGNTLDLGVKWTYVLKIIMKDSIDSNDDNYFKLNDKYYIFKTYITENKEFVEPTTRFYATENCEDIPQLIWGIGYTHIEYRFN